MLSSYLGTFARGGAASNLIRSQWQAGQMASVAVRGISGRGYINPLGFSTASNERLNLLLGDANGQRVASAFESDDFHAILSDVISEATESIDPFNPATHYRLSQNTRTLATDPNRLVPGLDPQHMYGMIRFGDLLLDPAGKALYERKALPIAIPTFLHASYPLPKWTSHGVNAVNGSTIAGMINPLLFPEKYQRIFAGQDLAQLERLEKGTRSRLGANTVEALTDIRRQEFTTKNGAGVYHAIIQGTVPQHIFTGYLIWIKGYTPDGRTFTSILGRGVDSVPIIQSLGNVYGGTLAWAVQQDVSDRLFAPENRHLIEDSRLTLSAFDPEIRQQILDLLAPRTVLLKAALDGIDYLSPFLAALKNLDVVRSLAGNRAFVPAGWDGLDPQLLMDSAQFNNLSLQDATVPLFDMPFLIDGKVNPEFMALYRKRGVPTDIENYNIAAETTLNQQARSSRIDLDELVSPVGDSVSDDVIATVVKNQNLPRDAHIGLVDIARSSSQVTDFRGSPSLIDEPPFTPEMDQLNMDVNSGTQNIFNGKEEVPFGPKEPVREPLEPVSDKGPKAAEGAGH